MASVQGDVPRSLHSKGGARAADTGVFRFEAGYGVGDGDHPHVHLEDDIFPGVCFQPGSDDTLSEHAHDRNPSFCCNPVL